MDERILIATGPGADAASRSPATITSRSRRRAFPSRPIVGDVEERRRRAVTDPRPGWRSTCRSTARPAIQASWRERSGGRPVTGSRCCRTGRRRSSGSESGRFGRAGKKGRDAIRDHGNRLPGDPRVARRAGRVLRIGQRVVVGRASPKAGRARSPSCSRARDEASAAHGAELARASAATRPLSVFEHASISIPFARRFGRRRPSSWPAAGSRPWARTARCHGHPGRRSSTPRERPCFRASGTCTCIFLPGTACSTSPTASRRSAISQRSRRPGRDQKGFDDGTAIGPRVVLAGLVDGRQGPSAGRSQTRWTTKPRRARPSTITRAAATSRSRSTARSSRS